MSKNHPITQSIKIDKCQSINHVIKNTYKDNYVDCQIASDSQTTSLDVMAYNEEQICQVMILDDYQYEIHTKTGDHHFDTKVEAIKAVVDEINRYTMMKLDELYFN